MIWRRGSPLVCESAVHSGGASPRHAQVLPASPFVSIMIVIDGSGTLEELPDHFTNPTGRGNKIVLKRSSAVLQ